MIKRKLYFACALHGMAEDYVQEMYRIRDTLRTFFEVLDFDKRECPECGGNFWKHDFECCVDQAELLVAIANERSTGMGAEIGVMVRMHRRPTFVLIQSLIVINPFFLEAKKHEPHFDVANYMEADDILGLVLDFEHRMFPKKK